MIAATTVLIVFQAAASPQPPKPSATGATGAWNVKRAVSKLDDSTTVTLSLPATSPIRAWPAKVAMPTLILRCKEGDIEAYVNLGARPAVEEETDRATLTLRFDKDPAYATTGGISTDGEAVFFPDAKPFIHSAAEHRSLW